LQEGQLHIQSTLYVSLGRLHRTLRASKRIGLVCLTQVGKGTLNAAEVIETESEVVHKTRFGMLFSQSYGSFQHVRGIKNRNFKTKLTTTPEPSRMMANLNSNGKLDRFMEIQRSIDHIGKVAALVVSDGLLPGCHIPRASLLPDKMSLSPKLVFRTETDK
jgi:hypothetical protein